MKCRKAFELELAEFVVDKGSDRWAAFRAHYPDCSDCSAEVAAWGEVEALLRSDEGATGPLHPSKDLLLRYEEERQTLAAAERETLARHLATCRSCPDELAALRTFDFSVLSRRASPQPAMWRTVVSGAAARLRHVLLHPAFAYALVVVLLYPAFVRSRLSARPFPNERIAQRGPSEHGQNVAPSVASEALPENLAVPPKPAAAQHATEVGKRPTRKEPREPSESKPAERAIATGPAPSEPVASGGSTESIEGVASEDLDDPDGEDARVLGLAETEEPRVDARQPRDAVSWQSVELAADRSPVVERATLRSGIILRLPPSAGEDAGRVVGPDGGEVAGQVNRPSATSPIEIRIRVDELVAGTYRVRGASELHFAVR